MLKDFLELLKGVSLSPVQLTRGKDGINQETIRTFIAGLDIPADAKARLMALTPATYIGKAVELARRC